MNMKKILLIIIACIFLLSEVVAMPEISIKANPEYKEGDRIVISYSILSKKEESISYIFSINCPNGPIPFLDVKKVDLQPGLLYQSNYSYMNVDESIETQNCSAFITIGEGYNLAASKDFRIITKPSFELEPLVCKDENCSEQSEIFLLSETVYLNYYIDIPNPVIGVSITYPDKTNREIILPRSFNPDQTGTYKLSITGKKEGYKKITRNILFGVIEKHPEIESISLCNGNKICDSKETSQNCPQDCPIIARQILSSEIKSSTNKEESSIKSLLKNYLPYIVSTAIIIIFIVLMILVIKWTTKKY